MFNFNKFKEFMMMNMNIPHTSKYHKESFIDHVMMMVDEAFSSGNRPLIIATMLHDIGKPDCHIERPGKGNTFYNHEKVGEEMVKLFLTEDDHDYKQVCFMVRNHMVPFQANGPEPWASYAQKQLIQFITENDPMWISNLFHLHKLDIQASKRDNWYNDKSYIDLFDTFYID